MPATALAIETPAKPFLTAEWRWLCVLNYEVEPELLVPHLPHGVELDYFQDKTYVSIVGFRFLKTCVLGLGVPCHRDFDEVNLRFYVRRVVNGELRRGVVFLREMVAKRMVAWVANWIYHENYRTVAMSSDVRPPQRGVPGQVAYSWNGGTLCRLSATFGGEPAKLVPGSMEEFILEHYWGYTKRRDGTSAAYQVEHPPWNIWTPETVSLEGDLAPYYGPAFADVLRRPCHSAIVADGSNVLVRRGRILN